VTPAETSNWIINADFDTLERKVRSFPDSDHPVLLTWALGVQRDPSRTPSAGIKWAVAIIGTLAPERFDDDDVLDAEVVE
jgi:hypothetical protein